MAVYQTRRARMDVHACRALLFPCYPLLGHLSGALLKRLAVLPAPRAEESRHTKRHKLPAGHDLLLAETTLEIVGTCALGLQSHILAIKLKITSHWNGAELYQAELPG